MIQLQQERSPLATAIDGLLCRLWALFLALPISSFAASHQVAAQQFALPIRASADSVARRDTDPLGDTAGANHIVSAMVSADHQADDKPLVDDPTIESHSVASPDTRDTADASNEANREASKLPPPDFRGLADRMSEATGRDPAWIFSRLGFVVVLFVGLVWVQRLFVPRSQDLANSGAIQLCGKVKLDAKQSLHLVRIGQRLLVLLESPHAVQRLAEITQPDEVQAVLAGQDPQGPWWRSADEHRTSRPRPVARNASELLAQIRDSEVR